MIQVVAEVCGTNYRGQLQRVKDHPDISTRGVSHAINVLKSIVWQASGNRYCDAQNYLQTEGLNIHQCAKKIRALQTVLQTEREEFVGDASIYAKSLCEDLEISFEPQDE
ncbi:uncharacterized protein TNCV_4647481 [Trichonephila clavipes]|uniref:Uncharacterized protein n=1 Tax=Trichonephila clavipes TaxID=2585209 RepID=A0A8X6SWQ6_TRICX|nr:uncharacterized protein TNCV_4647481 [Trichonephila clavipes]